jgi:hypothetical protein
MMSFLGMRTPFSPMGTPTQWLISRWMRITRSILKMLGIYKKSSKLILIRVGKSHLPHPAQNDGWDEWPQQEGELVGDNELNLVKNLANQVVVNAIENGLM